MLTINLGIQGKICTGPEDRSGGPSWESKTVQSLWIRALKGARRYLVGLRNRAAPPATASGRFLENIRHMICPSPNHNHLGGVSLAARPPQEDVGTRT
jgi:hypothetical protein